MEINNRLFKRIIFNLEKKITNLFYLCKITSSLNWNNVTLNCHINFRFPCCGKCYPCDICHEEKEGDHEMLLATRMICGHCCKEQPFAMDKACVACKQSMTQVRTQHWEGGKGCRDKIKMSK